MSKILKTQDLKINEKEFDEYRENINSEFLSGTPMRRNKITQGLFWTDLDKDLANQYVREEAWFFGWKFRDNLKLIDHCAKEGGKVSKMGF